MLKASVNVYNYLKKILITIITNHPWPSVIELPFAMLVLLWSVIV